MINKTLNLNCSTYFLGPVCFGTMKKDDEKEAFTVCRENVNINANKVKNIQKSKKKINQNFLR